MSDQAVVVGSGMCGLAAAQVLSTHFHRVLVIEGDQPQANVSLSSLDAARLESKARPGVMQYNALHAMSAKGLELYDDIFDGRFSETITELGGIITNNFDCGILHHPLSGLQPWLNRSPSQKPIMIATATRHLFEGSARRLLSENERVEFLYGVTVTGLVFHDGGGDGAAAADGTHEGKAVTGVRLSDGTTLNAALVVECSGRGSALPSWLAAAGYSRPRVSRVSCNAGYSAWLCKLAPETQAVLDANNVQGVVSLAYPPERTGSFLVKVEQGLYHASIIGNEGDYPGRSKEEVLQFAQKVWHPSTARLLEGCTFEAPIVHTHHLNSTWRHYEELPLPDGLIVLGDAICSLNPTYGQGMTVAVTEVTVLAELLAARAAAHGRATPAAAATAAAITKHQVKPASSGTEGEPDICSLSDQTSTAAAGSANMSASPDSDSNSGCMAKVTTTSITASTSQGTAAWLSGLHDELQKAIVPVIRGAWGLATSTDLRFGGSSSNEPVSSSAVERVVSAYIMALLGMASIDPVVHEAVMRVLQMLSPPESLMRPHPIARLLLHKASLHLPSALQGIISTWMGWGQQPITASMLADGAKARAALDQLLGVSKLEASLHLAAAAVALGHEALAAPSGPWLNRYLRLSPNGSCLEGCCRRNCCNGRSTL